jgi:protein TonB
MAVGAILLSSFVWTQFDVSEIQTQVAQTELIEEEEIPINITAPPPPPPPPPVQTTVIEIVEDEEEIEEELDLDLDFEEDTEVEEFEIFEEEEEPEEALDYFKVEKLPAFPGCEDVKQDEIKACTEGKVITFVQSTAKYPEIAKEAGIDGTVYVYYEIDKKGNVANAKVVRSVHKYLDEAALDAVKKLPKHTPGSQQGKAVAVKYNIPVRFTIK